MIVYSERTVILGLARGCLDWLKKGTGKGGGYVTTYCMNVVHISFEASFVDPNYEVVQSTLLCTDVVEQL